MIAFKKYFNIKTAVLLGAAVFFSCKNDPKEVEALALANVKPVDYVKGMDMIYTDSGRISTRLIAPLVYLETIEEEGDQKEDNVRRFPEGIEIINFDKSDSTQNTRLVANWAIYYEKKGLAEARGNVIVYKGTTDSLLTEKLIWDQRKKIFYSEEYTRAYNEGNILIGKNGFEADENFDKVVFKNSSGEIEVNEEEQSSKDSIQ